MTLLTREDVVRALGHATDDNLVLEILKTRATIEQLGEALAWLAADDAMMRSAHRPPHGVVAEICEIIARSDAVMDRD